MLPYCKKPFEHVVTHIEHLMSAKHEFSVKADPHGVVSQSETLVSLRVRLSGSVFLAIGQHSGRYAFTGAKWVEGLYN